MMCLVGQTLTLPYEALRGVADDQEQRDIEHHKAERDAAPDDAPELILLAVQRGQIVIEFVSADDPTVTSVDGHVDLQQMAEVAAFGDVFGRVQVGDVRGRGHPPGQDVRQVVVEGKMAADGRGRVGVEDGTARVPDLDPHVVNVAHVLLGVGSQATERLGGQTSRGALTEQTGVEECSGLALGLDGLLLQRQARDRIL